MTNAPNPYRIEGPALISFSGGRTSAYMLYQILQAHGGTLPEEIVVVFANTGLEREETLRFVYECGSRWGVKIHWLEWSPNGCEEVGFNSASRNGEPFKALVQRKSYTPNGVTRFCTQELKIRVMRDFCIGLNWERWNNVIGLRFDEGTRVFKALARNDANKERFKAVMPLASRHAKVLKRDVMRFWIGVDAGDPLAEDVVHPQGFDLGLRDYEGNCTLCFLKGRKKIVQIIRERPGIEKAWVEMEVIGKGTFSSRYSYADLARHALASPTLPGIMDDDWDLEEDGEEFDVECGLWCAPEGEAR